MKNDETKTLLWLDDIRNPFQESWLIYSPIEKPYQVIWVKNYHQFVDWISQNGLPDAICFDHDLSDEHYNFFRFPQNENYNEWELKQNFKEKTGYDCAKWLTEYCSDNNLDIPLWNIQSANPYGKEKISRLLTSFIRNRVKNNINGSN